MSELDLWDPQGYEDAIINCAFSLPEYHPNIFKNLKPVHFRPGLNRKVFAILQGLYNQHKENHISNNAIITELNRFLKDEKKDWNFWVRHLMSEAPLPTDIDFYVKKIVSLYNKRYLFEINRMAQERIEEGDSNEEVAEYIKSSLENMEKTDDSNIVSGFELISDVNDCLDEGNDRLLCGIPTGYSSLDKHILGLRRGDLIVLAGRPSMGKTTLMMNVSSNAAKQGYRGLMFSMEMAQYRLGLRLLASLTKIDLNKLSKCQCDVMDRNKIPDYINNLLFEFSTGLTCFNVESVISKVVENHHIDFIALDYLQKLKFPGKIRHDLEVGNATTLFKNIAKEYDLPFILLSQLSRSNVKDSKTIRKPRLSDLRDSGMIENDADIVLMIHRDDVYEETENNLAEIDIAKNRDGDTGVFELYFNKRINRFENLDKKH